MFEVTLELTPAQRVELIDVSRRVADRCGDLLRRYKKALYYSYHTTAGYFDERLCARLNHSPDSMRTVVESFQQLFPPDADYRHDQMHLRTELSEAQRECEPRNGDSHLTFISSGLTNCATYHNRAETPVFFVDLDGVYDSTRRTRQTTVIGFDNAVNVASAEIEIPVSNHPIDSVNLKDARLGLFEQLNELIRRHDVRRGRIDLTLSPDEEHTGLTVNEYETLLMQHDLVEVLRNPVGFMAEKGRHMLSNPRLIPGKALNYAKYDLVHLVNQTMDVFGLSESVVERFVDQFLAWPAARFLWMKRRVSMLVTDSDDDGYGEVVQGTYQTPIMVQWKKNNTPYRRLNLRIVRFE